MKARNPMHRRWIRVVVLLALFSMTATVALAAIRIKGITTSAGDPISTGGTGSSALLAAGIAAPASSGSTSCQSPSPLQLAVCFSLGGVGKPAVDVTATVTEVVTTMCTNPGGNQAPGRNPVRRTLSAEQTFQSDKNGNVNGTIITPLPGAISAREAGCPSNNWTARAVAVDFQTLHFVVDQNGATQIAKDYVLP
jgi:hypothetical protein